MSISTSQFLFKLDYSGADPSTAGRKMSRTVILLRLLFAFVGGSLYAVALPPLNCELLVFVSIFMLYLAVAESHWRFSLLAGWVWGFGWAIFAFRFLREIDPALPWLMASIISAWPTVWAGLTSFLKLKLLSPIKSGNETDYEAFLRSPTSFWHWFSFTFGSAALFTLLEWTRSRLFPWNDLAATQYRHLVLIQLVAFTGSYGINFLISLGGGALYAAYRTGFKGPGLRVLLITVLLLNLAILGGSIRLLKEENLKPNWFPATIQGNIPQQRNASSDQAFDALNIYLELSRKVLTHKPKPEIILWPESAVPVPYRSTHPVSLSYRFGLQYLIRQSNIPMLIGALDFESTPPGTPESPNMTNSALFFDSEGQLCRKYDKIHRVPYGEYIPFRRFLPDFIIRRIDMNRDLAPGHDYQPIELRSGIRAGTAICYESIFSYLAREFARRGANVLVVLSNDAWYPQSSEPEQHLANAMLRAVETGLPMLRCGNNGGSLLITPYGRITQPLPVSGPEKRLELRRGQGIKTFAVSVDPNPKPTFYVQHGEWFIAILFAITVLVFLFMLARSFKLSKIHHQSYTSN